jgi:dTDP-4-dehydrorhamnose 3,5-epimerase
MRFVETTLPGACVIELERIEDERGFNARAFCAREFEAYGLDPRVAQANVIGNPRRGTLRGLHWQAPPHTESKLFRCLRGAVYDVIVDLRPGSPTRGRWTALTLAAGDDHLLYVPAGFAQGFMTLEDDTELHYQVSAFYVPEAGRGIRYDDPALAIVWPIPVSVISERDASWPAFDLDAVTA